MRHRIVLVLGLSLLLVLVAQLLFVFGLWRGDPGMARARHELIEQELDWVQLRLEPLSPEERVQEVQRLRHLVHLHLQVVPTNERLEDPMARPLSRGQVLVGGSPPTLPRLGWMLLPQIPTLVLVAFLAALGWPLLRDLGRLEQAASAVAAGDLRARAQLSGPARDVGDAFDGMAEAVEAMVRNQKHLLHAVSHEIRTPLARMRFRLETLPADIDTTALQAEIDAVDALLTELLHYQRLGQAPAEEPMEPDAIHDLVQRTVTKMGVLSTIAIEVDLKGPMVMGPRDFTRVLENLISNAQRHARSVIQVTVGPDLVVEDDGPGVPADIRPTIFEPFATGDPSRSRELGGIGLGLALVKRTAERWSGDVFLDDSPLGGARFTVVSGR